MGAPRNLCVSKCEHPHIAAKKVMCSSQYYFGKSLSGINSPIKAYCSKIIILFHNKKYSCNTITLRKCNLCNKI